MLVRRSIMSACAIVTVLMSSVTRAADTPAMDGRILDAVRTVRGTVVSAVSAGRATATYERREDLLQFDLVEAIPKHRVVIAFAGESSLVVHYAADDKTVDRVELWNSDSLTDYVAGENRTGGSVGIVRTAKTSFGPDLTGWHYKDIAKIPKSDDDGEFFADLKRYPNLKVLRDGQSVKVVAVYPIAPEYKHLVMANALEYEFDMRYGGMLNRFRHVHKGVSTTHTGEKRIREVDQVVTLSWRKANNGAILPVQRIATTITKSDAGAITHRVTSKIEFADFALEPVSEDELTMDRMGIPKDTVVVDSLSGLRWKYFPGAGAVRRSSTSKPVVERK